ncbi:hypothetical protein NPIL_508571 [Nephila pilipes]|uniref:Uncharacterized protein n=1 Tax=Nephila pilipes TaxID=299642 RepID=A0A8X6IRK5_NEPPI|nr:hypothetical protein NPIL_508571 [Nephila pilipes]
MCLKRGSSQEILQQNVKNTTQLFLQQVQQVTWAVEGQSAFQRLFPFLAASLFISSALREELPVPFSSP